MTVFADYVWRVHGDHFPLLYHHGNADSCSNYPKCCHTGHVQFIHNACDLGGNEIEITVDRRWKDGCLQVWNLSCVCYHWHRSVSL